MRTLERLGIGLLLAATCLARPVAAADDPPYPLLSFHTLSCFKCNETFTGPNGDPLKIPRSLQRLNGHNVSVVGFLVPLQLTKDHVVTAFALCRSRGYCCYGVTPNVNELILCQVPPGHVFQVPRDMPMRVSGTLEVGARFAKSELLSIYRMEVESTEPDPLQP